MLMIYILAILAHSASMAVSLWIHHRFESRFISCGKKYFLLMGSIFLNFATVIFVTPEVYTKVDNEIQATIIMIGCLMTGLGLLAGNLIGLERLRSGKKITRKN